MFGGLSLLCSDLGKAPHRRAFTEGSSSQRDKNGLSTHEYEMKHFHIWLRSARIASVGPSEESARHGPPNLSRTMCGSSGDIKSLFLVTMTSPIPHY